MLEITNSRLFCIELHSIFSNIKITNVQNFMRNKTVKSHAEITNYKKLLIVGSYVLISRLFK